MNCLSVFDHYVGLALKGLTRGKLKFSFPTIFVNTEKLKKSHLGTKILVPKSGNRCHFWPVVGPDNAHCITLNKSFKVKV